MLKARLVPTQLAPDITVQTFKQTIKLGRSVLCEERKKSRHKACRYAKHIRARGFSKGYQEGLAAAQEECAAALRALRSCYEDALSAAKHDAHALATALAERIIDSTLLERPEVLLAWIQESLQMLKRSRTLHLSFQPRYSGVMQQVMPHLPEGITAQADSSLTEADFIMNGESGGVEFSWRNILQDNQISFSQGAQ
jgi:flagellar biosynthesis/type III secretory pathway protein FliH